jgi:hypothetical protein
MDAMEHERLTKAHQAAQLLAADLREAHAKTDNMAAEILLLDMIEQVERISQRLDRLASGCVTAPDCRPCDTRQLVPLDEARFREQQMARKAETP